jgi:TRAP-type C4-dicarboxylate transport system permease small subunit
VLTCVRRSFERLLEAISIVLLTALAVLVLAGIFCRTIDRPLVWYDEVASILLAWLTYYGSALAALKRAHIGCPGIVKMLPPPYRRLTVLVAETLVFAFFALLAYVGWIVFEIVEGDTLVSISWMPQQVAQSIIPIGAVLFIAAEGLVLPEIWRDAGIPAVKPEAPSAADVARSVLSTE